MEKGIKEFKASRLLQSAKNLHSHGGVQVNLC
jgi:hypothetical protein